MSINIDFPIKGVFKGGIPGSEPEAMSPNMDNVMPVDVEANRIRLGQRPGLDKWSTTLLSDSATPSPIVDMVQIAVVVP